MLGQLPRTQAKVAGQGQALRDAGGSFQTIEREISALTKLSHALDVFAERHGGKSAADFRVILAEGKAQWRTELAARSGGYTTRAYPDPEGLYAAIRDAGLRLQVKLMGETGCPKLRMRKHSGPQNAWSLCSRNARCSRALAKA